MSDEDDDEEEAGDVDDEEEVKGTPVAGPDETEEQKVTLLNVADAALADLMGGVQISRWKQYVVKEHSEIMLRCTASRFIHTRRCIYYRSMTNATGHDRRSSIIGYGEASFASDLAYLAKGLIDQTRKKLSRSMDSQNERMVIMST